LNIYKLIYLIILQIILYLSIYLEKVKTLLNMGTLDKTLPQRISFITKN